MRLRIDLAYDGTDFHGWATQPGLRTIQDTLEEWTGKVLRLNARPTMVVAGRTDAGVHARRQSCHVDLDVEEDLSATLERRLRRVLPHDIAIRGVSRAPEGFDARFSALWRRYCYRLSDGVPDPLLRGHITAMRDPMNVATLNAAAELVTGLRDFAAFCRPRARATTIRNLRELSAERRPDGVIEIHLLADAFCHSMVRSLVGALTAVAAGKRTLAWLEEVAASEVRYGDLNVMPARGLTLEDVGYPPDNELAARALATRARRTLEER